MAPLKTRDGTVLTDELIEALADEAERGYDLSRATRVYVGRPPLGGRGPAPRLNIRLDDKLAKAVRARARKENRTVSDIARAALREYVGRWAI